MAGKIFLSYRRKDAAAGFALALFHRLEQSFPSENLFMDVEGGIGAGQDFVQALEDEVSACDVMLVLIGPDWLTATDERGSRRLDNPEDFVRIEVELALRFGKRVIPVLVQQTDMPRADALPESLMPLARRHAVGLTQERFKADAQGLIKALEGALAEVGEARRQATIAEKRRADDANKAEEAARREKERARLNVDRNKVRIHGISFVQEKKWSGHELAAKLEKLDHSLIDALTEDDEAAPEVLAAAYIDYPDTWRLLIDPLDNIVGYWRFAPLTERWYERARSGLLLDKELSVETMRYIGFPGNYDVYVPIMGLLPEYRNARGHSLLFRSFMDALTELAKAEIFIGRVCATTFTAAGERLCEELGMERLRTHSSRGTVFEDKMADIIERLSSRGPLLKGYKFIVRKYTMIKG